MALSGSTNFEPNVAEFIEEAFERCGLELRTGYDLKTARRSINFLLAEWANRGLNQWTIEQATQTVTQGTASYTLNSNVIDVLDCSLRRTEGGTTTDLQTARRSINFLLAEWANRGLNQWTIEQATQTVTQGTASYTLNSNVIDVLDCSLRRTEGGTTTDLQMSRISRSEYLNIPTKATQSRPSQFFLDKLTTPVLKVWPTPENSTDILVFNKIVRMDDADAATNTLDMPFRFYPCFVAGLAYYVSLKRAPERSPNLKQIYEEEFRRAADQDEDRASLKISPYSRGGY